MWMKREVSRSLMNSMPTWKMWGENVLSSPMVVHMPLSLYTAMYVVLD